MGFHVPKGCALAAIAISAAVHAQVYPSKPIRMIVAYPPGGGTDIVGRLVAQKLGETLGQSIVVENRGGASGNIGTEIAAHAAPDGYTILMGNVAPNAINVSLFKNLPFDPVADFAPVSLVASTPNILIIHPSTPARTVKEVIALAKSKPGTLNFASADQGFEPVGNSLPGFEANTWHGVVLPAGASPAIVTRLNCEIVAILRLPDVVERLSSQGAEPVGSTPEEFAAYIKSGTVKWARVVRESGAKAE